MDCGLYQKSGEKVYVNPLGASDEIGSLRFDYIFHSSSSGGTQAGLEVGKRLFGVNAQIIGVSADNSVANWPHFVRFL